MDKMSVTNSDLPASRKMMNQRGQDYVGFANFPNQVFRRCIKSGFQFTIMVVGQSGLGKSTFLNSLFLAEIHDSKSVDPLEISPTVSIETKNVRLVENDVRLDITFVDCPGFGDLLDNSHCWEPVISYIDGKFGEYLAEETKIERSSHIDDGRVHLCLYFIAPTGHGLKALDVEFMRALHDRVNLVPIIAKADTLTQKEMSQFKQNILDGVKKHNIRLYEFPDPDAQESQVGKNESLAQTLEYRKRIPFAVVGSNQIKENPNERDRRIRIREYQWGTVEVENLAHNDFVALRDMVIRKNLIDLIEVTKNVHYENFRVRQMSRMPKNSLDNDPFTAMEQERKTIEQKAEEMRNTKERIFRQKVSEHEQKIDERTAALDREEDENRHKLDEKRAEIEKLEKEIMEIRHGGNASIANSGSSLRSSPPTEKAKKTLGLFRKN